MDLFQVLFQQSSFSAPENISCVDASHDITLALEMQNHSSALLLNTVHPMLLWPMPGAARREKRCT